MFLSWELKVARVFGEKILRSPKMNTSCSEIKKKSILMITQNSNLHVSVAFGFTPCLHLNC